MKAKVILEDGGQVEIEINESDGKLEKPQSFKRWRAEGANRYYCVAGDGKVYPCIDINGLNSIHNFATGNYFQTREEAEAYNQKLLKTQAIKDRIRELNRGWVADWGDNNQKTFCFEKSGARIRIGCYVALQFFHDDLYMKSEEVANRILNEFGKDLNVLF